MSHRRQLQHRHLVDNLFVNASTSVAVAAACFHLLSWSKINNLVVFAQVLTKKAWIYSQLFFLKKIIIEFDRQCVHFLRNLLAPCQSNLSEILSFLPSDVLFHFCVWIIWKMCVYVVNRSTCWCWYVTKDFSTLPWHKA